MMACQDTAGEMAKGVGIGVSAAVSHLSNSGDLMHDVDEVAILFSTSKERDSVTTDTRIRGDT